MTLATWFSLLAICCLGAMSPGPSLAVVLRHTISNGRAHGMVTAISHAAGVAIWALLTVWGLPWGCSFASSEYEPMPSYGEPHQRHFP